MSESVEERLTRLIADANGVSPEEVTSAWILRKRQEEIYPTMEFRSPAANGGHNPEGLRFLSGNEIDSLAGWGAEWLEQFLDQEALEPKP